MKWVTRERLTRRQVATAAMGTCLASLAWPEEVQPPSSPRARPAWRGDFPLLDQEVEGRRIVYLDSAATTQRPAAVIDAMAEFYRRDNANPGRALHFLARRAHERYEDARRTVAEFIHAKEADEIVWTRGTTEAINLVAIAWGESELKRGDEILLTLAEHASNLLPWRLVAERVGAVVKYVNVDAAGRILLDDLERKLCPRTRFVAFSHVSNVTGYVSPAAEICARAHRAGALVLIDAAQSVPHLPIDVQGIGCDFLAFSSHKMLGPMGVGVLWGRRELLDRMRPYQVGSNMAHDVDVDAHVFELGARRFGAGTPNVCGPVGLAAAIRYLRALDGEVQSHEEGLIARALAQLQRVPGLRLLGPPEPEHRVPVFSFVLANQTPADVLEHLDSQGIAVRAGDLAALPLLKHFGVTSAVRASAYLYTQAEEFDQLAAALLQLVSAEKRP
jgi:cysteine desulfurase / selenocysteine lyase